MGDEQDKLLARRLVEGINTDSLEVLDRVGDAGFARAARQWIGAVPGAFADFGMEILALVADEEKVAAQFRCLGTHPSQWRGHRPSGRRFCGVDEIYIYWVRGGKLAAAAGMDDSLARMRQLGLLG